MDQTQTDLRTGLAFHRAGRYDRAERIYRAVLGDDPQNPEALHLIGLVLLQRSNVQAAADYVRQAVRIAPGNALYRNSLGEIERARGDGAAAAAEFRRAIEIDPRYAEAHNNLGVALRGLGQLDDAIDQFRRAGAIDPDSAEAFANLAVALSEAGDSDGAVVSAERAVSVSPARPQNLIALGGALLSAGRPAEAVEAYRQALSVLPDHAPTLANLGLALHRLGESEPALAALLAALQRDPDRAEAHNSLGAVLLDRGDIDGAIARYRRALALAPSNAAWHRNLGAALLARGRVRDAIESLKTAIRSGDGSATALVELGSALLQTGQSAEAIACFDRALATDPDCHAAFFNLVAYLPAIAGWSRQAELRDMLPERLDRLAVEPPKTAGAAVPLAFSLPYFDDDPWLHRRALEASARHVAARAEVVAGGAAFEPPTGAKPLRIGYVSPDFGDHPIGHVTLPVYQLHDRREFEVHCYALQDRRAEQTAYHETIRQAADSFVDLGGMGHREAAARVHADGIHILVDLCGYMRYGRPEMFALKPAPIQVYWLGHGGGLGAPWMDYVIGDPVVTPPEDDPLYAEAVARLPDSFSSAPRAPITDDVGARADHGLPEDAVVLCAFNNALKIEAETVAAWLDVMVQVPDTVLWLTASRDPALREALAEAARARGVDPARLIYADRVPDKGVHLGRHRLADLFLDSFKFNASTTALDALWAGLPVLTRQGRSFHGRIAASYLRSLGMDTLICADTATFVQRAVDLARSADHRADLRNALDAARLVMPLFDEARFVRHLEAAYRRMWWQFSSGAAPVGFEVGASAPRLDAAV